MSKNQIEHKYTSNTYTNNIEDEQNQNLDVINEISEEIKQDIINVVKVLFKLTDYDLDLYTTVSEELIGKGI